MPRSFLVKKTEKVRSSGDEAARIRSPLYYKGVDLYREREPIRERERERQRTPEPEPCYSPRERPLTPPPTPNSSSSEPLVSAVAPYTPAVQPLAVRITNGYIHDVLASSPYHYTSLSSDFIRLENKSAGSDGESLASRSPLSVSSSFSVSSPLSVSSHCSTSPTPTPPPPPLICTPPPLVSTPPLGAGEDRDYQDALENLKSPRGASFQNGVTIGYTYDAFFITDGRSRKKPHPLGIPVPDQTKARYTCSECGKHYATSSNLSRHKQTHRSLDSQSAKTCPHCHKVYVSMPALSMHILTHELKHQCTVCNKAFSRPWLLQGHLRSHTGEKPYGCAHCGKAFADRSNLRAHMQTHSAFKHYKCKRCDKTFALKSYLNKHYESACFKE